MLYSAYTMVSEAKKQIANQKGEWKMTTKKEMIVIPKEADRIWEILLDFQRYPEWRECVSEIEVIDEKHYREFNKERYSTIFGIEKTVPFTYLKLSLESESVTGYREFLLTSMDEKTKVEIKESISSKMLSTRPIGKSVSEQIYIRKDLEQLVEDLRKI